MILCKLLVGLPALTNVVLLCDYRLCETSFGLDAELSFIANLLIIS
jgi:hypothetical protein